MPGRTFNSNSYKYGFNKGSEKDDEISGSGNMVTTHFRELDTRLGRWWGLDPKANPSMSPYVSMDNSPIWLNDPMGDVVDYGKKGEGRLKNKINSFFGRLFSKTYRDQFDKWSTAKTEDGSDITYHLQKTADKPNLFSGGEVSMNTETDKTVKYAHIIGIAWESETIGSDRHGPKDIDGFEKFKKGSIETITNEHKLKGIVPGFNIQLSAATIPDQFTVVDNSTSTNIQAPILLGGLNYTGVTAGKTLTLNNVTATDVSVIVTSNRVNPCTSCQPNTTNTDYTITYEKYKGLRIKIPIPKGFK